MLWKEVSVKRLLLRAKIRAIQAEAVRLLDEYDVIAAHLGHETAKQRRRLRRAAACVRLMTRLEGRVA